VSGNILRHGEDGEHNLSLMHDAGWASARVRADFFAGGRMGGILFATHGGPTAEGAGRVATLLAERRGTTLSALCVIEPFPLVDGGFGGVYVPTAAEEEAVQATLRASVAAQLKRWGVSVTPQMRIGSPASEIADAARAGTVEVIVVGLGRHHLLDRALGHETALELVQLASTPVLAVPAGMTSLPRRAVAAVDFSPTSVASARICSRWLAEGDVLHLVHVAGVWYGGLPFTLRAGSQSALDSLASELGVPHGVTVETSVVEGEPAAELLELATRKNADLIVLGSHGYGLWKRLTIGSVASKIIRLTSNAVLVTPIGSLTADAAQTAKTESDAASV
jgi:nucleotide-binding universal stress UspA family protein